MHIIEERVVLAGQEFSRSELLEIASFLELDSLNHTTLYLKTSGTVVKDVPVYDNVGSLVSSQKHEVTVASALRKSKAIQKALQANLFENFDISQPVRLKSELSNIILYYRGKSK